MDIRDEIYVVEDEEDIRQLLLYTLESANYSAKGFSNSREFFENFKLKKPLLVILDIMLPGEDGIEILKKIRALSKVPIIMASAKSSEIDKVRALDLGADDYMVKPFGMMEMLSRVRAVLRRNEIEDLKILKIDEDRREIRLDGRLLDLTKKEYELLNLMAARPGFVFTREVLLDKVWGYEFSGNSRTVDVHIKSLRKKLKSRQNILKTVHGVGYSFDETDG